MFCSVLLELAYHHPEKSYPKKRIEMNLLCILCAVCEGIYNIATVLRGVVKVRDKQLYQHLERATKSNAYSTY